MSIKAFELVSAIERVKLMSDKAKTQIECLDVCGKNMYIGTSDCFVVHYSIEEKTQSNGRVTFITEKQGHKFLLVKKPVVQLRGASALNRIMVLCDNTLTLLNMFDLEPIVTGAKVKGVVCFCINENPLRTNPFSVEICVALKKKVIQLYTVTEDRLIHLRDVNVPDLPLSLGVDGIFVCAALTSQYCMIDMDGGHITELFPIDSEQIHPVIKRISKEEFLLSGPSALGIFATSAGVSQRPPMQWSDRLTAVCFVHPYILAMNDEFITVHSILDQQQKQAIPFQGGVFLGDFDGRIFVASGREIYSLVPIPFEKQIQALLADKRVTEALDLARNANKTGMSRDKFLKMFKTIQQQAAFIEFSRQQFDEASQLFKESSIDVREIICLYPHYLPAHSNFTRSVPPLHEIADINQLSKSDENLKAAYKDFLKTFLEEIKGTNFALGYKREVDVALLKLYAELMPEKLSELISVDTGCDLGDCVEWLEKYNRLHALGLLYQRHGESDKALGVWTRLVDSQTSDPSFPGLDFVVDFLANLTDHELLWKYVDWILEKDEELGVRIFTDRPTSEAQSERLRPEMVIDYLHRFPKAIITYLEYLIFQRKLEKEKYHTHLAVLYLEDVLKLMESNNVKKEELDIARSKLRHMLQMSNLYRVQLILGKAKEKDMHAECAILYGKLEEHDKALRILVHKLKDYGAAENYCQLNSQGKEPGYRKRLYHVLLSVYLDPSYERRDTLVAPAIALLNSSVADFDTLKVLHLLPDNWSIGLLSQFLTRAMRMGMHNYRMTRIQRMMARGENLLVKQNFIEMQREAIVMNDEKTCAVCNRAFNDSTFVRYPNGVITHVHCAKNKYVCPVSGKLFSVGKR
ncbi:transforming growth factor-beta receptor-associated protein 1-like [Biomphalaria glabrata]|uniref:Transforming growth factor-beta receptor-associated protein 1-like n=2 Tax=Biomphalaria glabrata TaxID=6526 RepID=A0A9W3BNZ0_BIOGL|nr:transforming growth factor-beta receptor-associated protein 1-like [Biomphalaria glabrata]KAI8729557.1 transforming growth factor-beta receptor-associated protein 1 [Biomphalaria glabrata]